MALEGLRKLLLPESDHPDGLRDIAPTDVKTLPKDEDTSNPKYRGILPHWRKGDK